MAVEVDQGAYLSGVSTSESQKPEASQDSLEDAVKRRNLGNNREPRTKMIDILRKLQQTTSTRKAFRYNPTHDLESLFWIALYFVINKEARPAVSSDSVSLPQNMESYPPNTPNQQSHSSSQTLSLHYTADARQRTVARDLFYNQNARMAALVSDVPLREYFLTRQEPALLPVIGWDLCELRATLYQHYITIGKPGYHIDNSVCQKSHLYAAFESCFSSIIGIIDETQDLVVSRIPPDLNVDGVLRSASHTPSRASLLSALKSKLKRKAALETPRTSVLPVPKRSKPAQDSSETSETSGSKDVFD